MKNKIFNIIISGVGGQGVMTLLSVINEAAFVDGHDVKSSEFRGFSQRGGQVEAHIRFGSRVYSPLVQAEKADLIIALEISEGLRSLSKSGKQTKVLINDHCLPFYGSWKLEEIRKYLGNIGLNLSLVPASKVCKENLQNDIADGMYLLGYAANKKIIPIRKESFLQAIKNTVPEKYLELNIKAFKMAYGN